MNLVGVAILGTNRYIMACSANHSKGSGSAVGAGLIVGQPGWLQRKINLRPQHRGVHLVTEEILRQVGFYSNKIRLPQIIYRSKQYEVGYHLFSVS